MLTGTPDLGDQTLEQAREFPGYTSLAVADGQLLVTSAETPIIQRFAITDALTWEDAGEPSLIDEGVVDSGFYRQYMQRDEMAYAELDVAKRTLWDPVSFEVAGTEVDTELPLTRDGYELFANYKPLLPAGRRGDRGGAAPRAVRRGPRFSGRAVCAGCLLGCVWAALPAVNDRPRGGLGTAGAWPARGRLSALLLARRARRALLHPARGNDFSHSTVYELGLDGEATRRFQVPGSSYQWLRVR